MVKITTIQERGQEKKQIDFHFFEDKQKFRTTWDFNQEWHSIL
jgi:hypothetical protein